VTSTCIRKVHYPGCSFRDFTPTLHAVEFHGADRWSPTMLCGSLPPRHETSWRCGRRNTVSRYGGQLRIYCISGHRQSTIGGSPAWGLREGLTTTRKKADLLRNVTESLELGRTQDRDQRRNHAKTVLNLQVIQKVGNLTSWVTVSFSRRTLLHGISYFSRFRPHRKHTASQLQRSVGLCLEGTNEHGNEPSGSIKGGEFFD
jgi:hypothetical protein